MKNIASITVILLFSFLTVFGQVVTPVSGSGSQGQQYMDAETLGQAYLLHNWDHYAASLYAQNPNGKDGTEINMILDQNLFITNMTINQKNIPLPKPLSGIPVPAAGYQNVSVAINAIDEFGQIAAQGQIYENYIGQGARLKFKMTPEFPPVAVQLERGLDSNSLEMTVDGSNGWGWSYDPITGLLTIYISQPTKTEISYTVKNSAGALLAHGTLPFFQALPGGVTNTNSVFSLETEGGVRFMPLGERDYSYANNLTFNSSVTRNGVMVLGKVLIVPDINHKSKLYINTYGAVIGSIEVRKWSATGPMELVPSSFTVDSNGSVTVITSQYLGKAVITVLPAKDVPGTFQIYVGRTY